MGRTLYDKIWDEHVVHTEEDGTSILYIDRHLVHEVTSPQAFEGLRQAGRKVWRISKEQITTLNDNMAQISPAAFFPFMHKRQGIVHVIGPENGATLPGMTVVCGDSHTSTHGAFGALAHGIGTSEVEHVMATQTLLAKKAKNMLVQVDGQAARAQAWWRWTTRRLNMSGAAPSRPRAWNGTRPWLTGKPCTLMPTRSSTPWSDSTRPPSCRK